MSKYHRYVNGIPFIRRSNECFENGLSQQLTMIEYHAQLEKFIENANGYKKREKLLAEQQRIVRYLVANDWAVHFLTLTKNK